VDGHGITSPTALTTEMNLHRVGQSVTIAWLNVNGQRHSSSLTLVAGPNV